MQEWGLVLLVVFAEGGSGGDFGGNPSNEAKTQLKEGTENASLLLRLA